MLKRALISVYNKDNIIDLAKFLTGRNVEIISSGGTYKYLKDQGLKVTEISEVTGFDEILDGRVKTLHPNIHAGILAVRNNPKHMETIKSKGIQPIDMVVVNLYPFFEKVTEDISFEDKVEFIDIGGPTMLRAAAKNFQDVIVLSDCNDYKEVINQIENNGDVNFETKKKLAGKVFNLMSAYDAAISNFLLGDKAMPDYLSLSYKKSSDLRYGENPHQSAAYYTESTGLGAMNGFTQLNGKELSYNNIKDMDIAWKVVNELQELDDVACCALKHNSPCGAAIGKTAFDVYEKTYNCDPVSIFGGVVGFNTKVDKKTAEEMVKIFLEIVIAPDFDEDALEVLKGKKNLRVIKCEKKPCFNIEIAKVDGGILVQSPDIMLNEKINVVTEKSPSAKQLSDMIFGMKIVKYTKSNAIVVIKDGASIGIGAGQVNRIWAAEQALERSGEGAKDGGIIASDAYFPFPDCVDVAAKYGIEAIIQPGGSIHDQDSIDACNKNGICMVFTGVRHFKH